VLKAATAAEIKATTIAYSMRFCALLFLNFRIIVVHLAVPEDELDPSPFKNFRSEDNKFYKGLSFMLKPVRAVNTWSE
jgi:hypothetical protein